MNAPFSIKSKINSARDKFAQVWSVFYKYTENTQHDSVEKLWTDNSFLITTLAHSSLKSYLQ